MELDGLIAAVHSFNGEDAFRARLTPDQWRTFGQYLTPHKIRTGDLLARQGDSERAMYFVSDGSLQVFVTGAPSASRIGIVRAGAVVGESGLFADVPRHANAEAMTPCTVWSLRGPRLDELAQRSPQLAVLIVRALAGVMAVRLRAHIGQQQPMV